jgi:hypothetical protein
MLYILPYISINTLIIIAISFFAIRVIMNRPNLKYRQALIFGILVVAIFSASISPYIYQNKTRSVAGVEKCRTIDNDSVYRIFCG